MATTPNPNPSPSPSPSPTQKDQKPLVILHRVPTYNPKDRMTALLSNFSLLDPLSHSDPLSYLKAHGSSARALICVGPPPPLKKDTLDCLPSLECVVLSSVGSDHVDLPECRRRSISVANAGDSLADDSADCAVGLLVDVLRRVSGSDRFVRAGLWPLRGEYPLGSSLRGKRVGIVGLGSIGSRVTKRLLSFGCSIAYNSRHKKPSVQFPFYDNVHKLARDSDVLVVCCSLTDQTYHLINKDVMSELGKDGIIINIGRGALVDEKVMVQFLVEGKLGGAGLDVFEDEPNVPKELFGLDNVVLSPHNAVITPESMDATNNNVKANLEAFFSNKPLLTPITWE